MGFVVKLFFLMILSTILLSGILGWFVLTRSKLHSWHGKSRYGNVDKDNNSNVIEGEYKVLDEEGKR